MTDCLPFIWISAVPHRPPVLKTDVPFAVGSEPGKQQLVSVWYLSKDTMYAWHDCTLLHLNVIDSLIMSQCLMPQVHPN